MEFPRYWAKGETDALTRRNPQTGAVEGSFRCWGWSNRSLEDARAVGKRRADQLAEQIRRGEPPDRYGYGAPFREEVLDRWVDSESRLETPWAIVSRNGYGCRILNTASVLFADIDAPTPPQPGIFRMIFELLGVIAPIAPPPRKDWEAETLMRIKEVARARGERGMRIYRTRGGLRCLLTHRHAQPESADTLDLLAELGSDPLYIRLCKNRGCFRARLTPKPWRCGYPPLKVDFPWLSPQEHDAVQAWKEGYRSARRKHACCDLVEVLGRDASDARIARVVEFHDQETGVGSGLPLA